MSAKLPVIVGQLAAPNVSGTVAQFGMEYYAKDLVSGKSFAGGGAIWDSRPFGYNNGNEYVASDTFTPFASTPLMPGMKYSSPAPGSSFYCNVKPWEEWRWFKVTINASQLELAVHDVNKGFPGTNLSTSAANYVVSSVLFGNEVTGYFNYSLAYANSVANFSAYVENWNGIGNAQGFYV